MKNNKMNYKMSFQERARLGMEMLAKQRPFTLEEKREQVIRVKIRGSSKNKEEEVKYNLSVYHPDWTREQIDAEVIRLFKLYQEPYSEGGSKI